MKKCETCKHWTQEYRLDTFDPRRTGRYCSHGKLHEARNYEPDALVYDYDEGGGFWTGPQFGCVHHTERETS